MSALQKNSACSVELIDRYLDESLPGDDEQALLDHLQQCPDCCQRMQHKAADGDTWNQAESFLKDEAYDVVSLSSESHEGAKGHSVQIDSVLGILSPTDDPDMLGRLGSYQVSGVVGCGGMGVVVKALDPSLDRIIAIKVLAPHLASSGAARERFWREGKAAAAVLHPNVIAIHGVCNDAALPYLVMPYIRGQSLQRRLDQCGPLPLGEILRIGHQIAAGLTAAHEQGLVHRDIKPANILLEDGVERVTITDFGLARAVDDASMTRSGVIAGTPQYMSPEQARGDSIDARSDLFSLGSVLYAMCTGRSPFRAETCYGVLRRITDENVRPIRDINPDIPAWLCKLIERLHGKKPADRIQTAGELQQMLHQCIAHIEQPDKQSLPPQLLVREKHNEHPSNVPVAVFAGLLTVALIGMGLLSTWRGNGDDAKAKSESAPISALSNDAVAGKTPSMEQETSYSPDSVWDDGLDNSLSDITQQIESMDQTTQALFPREGNRDDAK